MLEKVCRLCANKDEYCIEIFSSKGDEVLLRHKIKIKQNDLFPKQVCLHCLNSLDQIYEFYQRVKAAQGKLQSVVEMETPSESTEKRKFSDVEIANAAKKICLGSSKVFSDDCTDTPACDEEVKPRYVVEEQQQTKLEAMSPSKFSNFNPPLYVYISKSPSSDKSASNRTDVATDQPNVDTGSDCIPNAFDHSKTRVTYSHMPMNAKATAKPLVEKSPVKAIEIKLADKECNAASQPYLKVKKLQTIIEPALEQEFSKKPKTITIPSQKPEILETNKNSVSPRTYFRNSIPQSAAQSKQVPAKSSKVKVTVVLAGKTSSNLANSKPSTADALQERITKTEGVLPLKSESTKVSLPGNKASSLPNNKDSPIKSLKTEPYLDAASSNERVKTSSSGLPFKKCRHCGKDFREDILAQHEKLHDGKPVFTCAECDGYFLYESTLKKHQCTPK